MALTPISFPLWGDRQTLAPTALCGRNVEFARVRHCEHACRVGAVAVSFHGLYTYHGLISTNIFHPG